MICCLCGEDIRPGDYFVSVTHNRAVQDPEGVETSVRVPMEDGSFRKVAHSVCPVLYGSPLALIGAERGSDV